MKFSLKVNSRSLLIANPPSIVTPQRSDLPGVLLRGATDTAIAQPFSDPLSLAFYCQRVTKLRDHPVFQTASKMAVGDVTLSYLLFTLLHFAQFVLAIVVCALYGIDLDRARKAHASADGKLVSVSQKPRGV